MNVTMNSSVSVNWDARISSGAAQGAEAAGLEPAQTRAMLRESVAEATKDAAAILQREDGMPRYVAGVVRSQADALAEAGDTQPLKEEFLTGGPDPRDGCVHTGGPDPVDGRVRTGGPDPLEGRVQTGGPDPRSGWQPAPEDRGTLYHTMPCEVTRESPSEELRNAFRELAGELTHSIVEAVRQELKNGTDGAGEASGGSWMLAIARAMGTVLGQKASRMVELSEKIQNLSGSGTNEASKMEAAAETQRLNTEFQATGQEFNLLQTTFSTAIKTLGEGMASVARRN